MTTILTTIQDAVLELGLPPVTSVVGNTDATVRQLQAFLIATAKDMIQAYEWIQMRREYQFSLVNGQSQYPFPADIDYMIFETHWAKAFYWELIGPMSPQDYQARKSGLRVSGPRQRYEISGRGTNQFTIYPTPSATDAGNIMVFNYSSTTWLLPPDWATATIVSAGAYRAYNGNIYVTTLGGTTGATPPTHTTGTVTDGAVLWTYSADGYTRPTTDSDVILLEPTPLKLGTMFRYMRMKGLKYDSIEEEYKAESRAGSISLKGSKTLMMASLNEPYLISWRNIPDSNYGV